MKYLITLLLCLIVISCDNVDKSKNGKFNQHKYKIYDLVYIYPDSTRAIITDTSTTWMSQYGNRYRIGLNTKEGLKYYTISEEMIISKVQ